MLLMLSMRLLLAVVVLAAQENVRRWRLGHIKCFPLAFVFARAAFDKVPEDVVDLILCRLVRKRAVALVKVANQQFAAPVGKEKERDFKAGFVVERLEQVQPHLVNGGAALMRAIPLERISEVRAITEIEKCISDTFTVRFNPRSPPFVVFALLLELSAFFFWLRAHRICHEILLS